MASSASFSCYKSDDSSCPTTPSSTGSHPNQEMQDIQDMQEEFHALQDENQFLRSKLDSLAETLEYMETRLDEQQSHKQWIAENLEEAQHFIDNIVGIKGITEAPLSAAVKMGISYAEPSEREPSYRQQQLPRVSISSSIVPSNEELYGY